MLWTTLKPGQDLRIGDSIVIRIADSSTRIGIEAPKEVKIIRRESPARADGAIKRGGRRRQ